MAVDPSKCLKVLTRAFFGFLFRKHLEHLVRGWLEDAIGIFENIMIVSGGKPLLEIFVKYKKIGWRSFLVPKSTKNCLCLVLKHADIL